VKPKVKQYVIRPHIKFQPNPMVEFEDTLNIIKLDSR